MNLEARIRQLRMKKGRSLQKAADEIGISKAHLWELEVGKSRNPSIDTLRNLATYYGVTISWLLADNDKTGAMFRDADKLDEGGRAFVQDVIDTHVRRMRGDEDR